MPSLCGQSMSFITLYYLAYIQTVVLVYLQAKSACSDHDNRLTEVTARADNLNWMGFTFYCFQDIFKFAVPNQLHEWGFPFD